MSLSPERIPGIEYRILRLESRVDNMEKTLADAYNTLHRIDNNMASEEAVTKALKQATKEKSQSLVNWVGISIQGGMLFAAVIALHFWG